jgi:hypothetical protein
MHPAPTTGRALVVCESCFGNTQAVADVVVNVLRNGFASVDLVTPGEAPSSVDDLNLLIVGAPTHAFGLSRPSTRQAARQRGGAGAGGRGVREWLDALRPVGQPVRAAAFDTRVRKPLIPGSAAHAIRRRLRPLGFDVVSAISFSVHRTAGPLVDGELDVARQWAERIERSSESTNTRTVVT